MLDFDAVGRTIRVRIAAVYRSERFRMGGLTEFTFTPATLAGLPAIDYGGVHVKPESVGRLQRALYERTRPSPWSAWPRRSAWCRKWWIRWRW